MATGKGSIDSEERVVKVLPHRSPSPVKRSADSKPRALIWGEVIERALSDKEASDGE